MPVAGNYEFTKKIGEGGYGKIFLARRIVGHVGEDLVVKQQKLPVNKQEREMCLRCAPTPAPIPPHLQTPDATSVPPARDAGGAAANLAAAWLGRSVQNPRHLLGSPAPAGGPH